MGKGRQKPPPLLMGCRITHYVVRDKSTKFARRTNLFVNGKELGSVPCLAIGESKTGEFLLLHCDRTWNVRGTEVHEHVSAVQQSAERIYPGISKRWLRTRVSKRQADAYRRKVWKGMECSFCRRLPDEFDGMVEKRHLRVCNICIREFNGLLRTERSTGAG
jgi:hypothetical protein